MLSTKEAGAGPRLCSENTSAERARARKEKGKIQQGSEGEKPPKKQQKTDAGTELAHDSDGAAGAAKPRTKPTPTLET